MPDIHRFFNVDIGLGQSLKPYMLKHGDEQVMKDRSFGDTDQRQFIERSFMSRWPFQRLRSLRVSLSSA